MADEVSVNPGPTPGQVQVEHSLQPLAGEIAKVHRRSTRGRVEGGTGSSKMTFPFSTHDVHPLFDGTIILPRIRVQLSSLSRVGLIQLLFLCWARGGRAFTKNLQTYKERITCWTRPFWTVNFSCLTFEMV